MGVVSCSALSQGNIGDGITLITLLCFQSEDVNLFRSRQMVVTVMLFCRQMVVTVLLFWFTVQRLDTVILHSEGHCSSSMIIVRVFLTTSFHIMFGIDVWMLAFLSLPAEGLSFMEIAMGLVCFDKVCRSSHCKTFVSNAKLDLFYLADKSWFSLVFIG